MKYLKRFNENLEMDYDEIIKICKEYGINKNWTLNSKGFKGLVSVRDHVNITFTDLRKLPLKFGKVTGNFLCNNNSLTTLEGSPKIVGGDFWCVFNPLTTLEGAPETVGGNFYCGHNPNLISFEGCPKNIGGNFRCMNTPLEEIWNLFNDFDQIELLNDFDPMRIIDGERTVILDRLNSFLEMIGKPTVTTLKKYQII